MTALIAEETIVPCPETDLLDEHGQTIWDAIQAFTEDPSYLAEIVESANLIDYKRQLWDIRSEAIKQADSPDKVREISERLIAERGLTPPKSRTLRSVR